MNTATMSPAVPKPAHVPDAAVYDPAGVGGTSVVTVLAFGSQPELYGLPRDPVVPAAVRLWKGPLKWVGNLAILGGLFGAAIHFVRFGRKKLLENSLERSSQDSQ